MILNMNVTDIINPANLVYEKSKLITDVPMHYCPGCSHGVVHKIIAELIDEMGLQEKMMATTDALV